MFGARKLFAGIWLIFLIGLTACTPQKTMQAVEKMAKVAMDPDLPIGLPKESPSVATFTVYSEADVNKNALGDSSPTVVWIFQLSDESKFMALDYETLTANAKEALGTSYVSHKEVQSEPNKSKIIDDWEIQKETRIIGVAVGYKNIDRVDWRTFDKIKPTGEKYKIVIVTKTKFVLLEVHR